MLITSIVARDCVRGQVRNPDDCRTDHVPSYVHRGKSLNTAILQEHDMRALLTGIIACGLVGGAHAEMPHNRRCDIAQDHPGNLNPQGGNAIMFGLCGGINDLPTGESPSRAHSWNAFSCGYQAYRQGKSFGANPYYNDDLETRWSEGWKAAREACRTGKGPFDR